MSRERAEQGIYIFKRIDNNRILDIDEYKSHSAALAAAQGIAAKNKCDIVFWHRNLVDIDHAYWTGYARTEDDRLRVSETIQ